MSDVPSTQAQEVRYTTKRKSAHETTEVKLNGTQAEANPHLQKEAANKDDIIALLLQKVDCTQKNLDQMQSKLDKAIGKGGDV